ncbi:MAG: hypothetical protein M1828_004003 [Chrysothrix sp. TS-e1954]|nr:MAG: hypothetical protein M1828_004003 [Chrysothrix sp. TS-e1954]
MATLTEDDVYRSSTQHRLWNFSRPALATLRDETNKAATVRVVHAIKRNKAVSNGDDPEPTPQPDTLTPSEELALTVHYTRMTLATATSISFPSAVAFTAATYMRRFYLSNSPMTYHPKDLLPTCLFLASKTENHFHSLSAFVRKMQEPPIRSKVSADEIRATEFVLCQGLRFAFEVKQPVRGLSGGLLELIALAKGENIGGSMGDVEEIGATSSQLQNDMMKLSLPPTWTDKKGHERRINKTSTTKQLEERIGSAHEHAKIILTDTTLLTDVTFLYTPSQVWLAALLVADEAVATFYLSIKLPKMESLASSIRTAVRSCATILASHDQPGSPSSLPREELVRIDRKLYHCRNPEKRDLVGLHKAQKRNGDAAETGSAEERAGKKRKAERERKEKDGEVFGGPLTEATNGDEG